MSEVPTFEGRLYTDAEPNGILGNWVRRAEVDALAPKEPT